MEEDQEEQLAVTGYVPRRPTTNRQSSSNRHRRAPAYSAGVMAPDSIVVAPLRAFLATAIVYFAGRAR